MTCTFRSFSKKGHLTLALSTNGTSPIYAKRLKHQLEALLPAEIEADLAFLEQARKAIFARRLSAEKKKQLLQAVASESFLREAHREKLLKEMLLQLQS